MGIINRHLVCVDGGGTQCRVRIASVDGTILAEVEGGPANIATDFSLASKNISSTIEAAYSLASLNPQNMDDDIAVLGLAGANTSPETTSLEKKLPFHKASVVSDRDITVSGALAEQDGSVALLGTGSFFVGKRKDKVTSIGGWGFQVGDEGGGARMGQMALQNTILAFDNVIQHSTLTQDILADFDNSAREIVQYAQTLSPAGFGAFAPKVISAMSENDPVAQSIFDNCLASVESALFAINAAENGPLCFLGGLGSVYEKHVSKKYQDLCTPPKGSALDGAFALASKIAKNELGV